MSKVKPAGLTEGFATLEIIKGFNFLKVNPQVFKGSNKSNDPTKLVDDSNSEHIGKFDGDILPEQKTVLSPIYVTSYNTYWQADIDILNYIVHQLNLRYPASHPDKPLQVIKPEDINPSDYYDYFFDTFKSDKKYRRVMEGGRYTFDLSDPADRLLYYSQLYSPFTKVEGEEISKYVQGKIKYKLMVPGQKEKQTIEVEDKDIESISFLSKKNGISLERQEMIARIMKVREVNFDNIDPDNLRVQLKLQVATNTKPSKVKGMTVQDRFVKLASAPGSQVTREYYITKAMDYNLIIRNGDRFRFNEEPIEGVTTLTELVDFYLDKQNANKYSELTDLVDSRDAQLNPNADIS